MKPNSQKGWKSKVLNSNIRVFLIFIICGFGLYWNTLHSPFTFDDYFTIVNNNLIKSGEILTKFNLPRYLGILTFAINYKMDKLNVSGYHIINILIHIANSFLIYLFIKKIISHACKEINKLIHNSFSFLTAFIFLVHPINTQAINYISQRYTILSAFFAISSSLLYLKFRESSDSAYHYLIESWLCALLAYKTKENTATLPLIIILIEFILLKDLYTNIKRKIIYIFPYFLLIIVIPLSLIATFNQPQEDALTKALSISRETPTITRIQYFITEFSVIITYIRLFFIPIHQSIDYYYPLAESFWEMKILLSFLFIIILLAIAIITSRKYAPLAFGIFWFFIFLLIESSIIPIADVIFEHRAYLPSFGLILAFAYLLFVLAKKVHLKGLYAVFALIIIVLSIFTYARNEIWKDEIALWKDAANKFPKNSRTHLNLGAIYAEKGMCDEAITELELGLKNDPYNELSRTHLAFCFWKKDRIEDAIKIMNYVMQLNKGFFSYYFELINRSLNQQRYEAALKLLLNAYAINDSNPIIDTLLGRTYCIMGNLDKAKLFYDKSISIDANNADTYYDIGFCLFNNKLTTQSRTNFLKAFELNPKYADAYFFIAMTYEIEGKSVQAKSYYQQFISISSSENPLFSQAQAKLHSLQ